jgi:hypothetical protein
LKSTPSDTIHAIGDHREWYTVVVMGDGSPMIVGIKILTIEKYLI